MKLTALLAAQMPEKSRILFVTSRVATRKLKERSTYCASKAGLDEVTAIMRKELAEKNIGVSCIILGGLMTSTLLNLLVMPTLALRYGRFEQFAPDVSS